MLTDIESKVQELYECLSNSAAHDLARSLISDIIYICGENINDQTIGEIFVYHYVLAFLFTHI